MDLSLKRCRGPIVFTGERDTREEFLGMRVGDLIPPEDLGDEPLKLATLHADVPVMSERRLRRKDGTLFPVEISATILSEGPGHYGQACLRASRGRRACL